MNAQGKGTAALDKACVVAGCQAYPLFGFGLPSGRLPMRWACADHRSNLTSGVAGAPFLPSQERAGALPGSRAPAPASQAREQGRLL